nr:hypothetical protein [Tanacetum cinerariifolium]
MQQPMQNSKDISDPTTVIDMTLVLMAKGFTLNNTTPTKNNQRSSSNPSNMQIAQLGRIARIEDDGDNAYVYWFRFKEALVRKLGLRVD